jgi:hypothetical protein
MRVSPSVAGDEEFQNYRGDLVAAVAAFRDRRALGALIGAIGTGNLATDGLADLGGYAVAPVIQALSSDDRFTRYGAVRTLGKVAARRSALAIDGAQNAAIRSALVEALGDDSFMVRSGAGESLMPFAGDDIRQLMVRVEATDPYQSSAGRWTVREAARAWLDRHGGPR